MDKSSLLKIKSIQSWSWIFLLSYFILTKFNVYFGFLGLICMFMPFYFILKYKSKIHCSHICPRGSFLGKFLIKISFNNHLPNWMRTKKFKNLLLTMMFLSFSFSLYNARGSYLELSFAIRKMMFISLSLGIVLGIFYKPRAWCQICPMGTGSEKLQTILLKSKLKN